MADKRKRKDVKIYKPNKNLTGSVFQFKIAYDDSCMFLECARQIAQKDETRPYDWENKIVMKLNEKDISQLLMYFKLHKPGIPIKLFHDSPNSNGNKTLDLKYQEYKGRPGYYATCSWQKDKGETANRISIPITMDEAEILKVALPMAIEVILGWRTPS